LHSLLLFDLSTRIGWAFWKASWRFSPLLYLLAHSSN
jgi:hypothetical protein